MFLPLANTHGPCTKSWYHQPTIHFRLSMCPTTAFQINRTAIYLSNECTVLFIICDAKQHCPGTQQDVLKLARYVICSGFFRPIYRLDHPENYLCCILKLKYTWQCFNIVRIFSSIVSTSFSIRSAFFQHHATYINHCFNIVQHTFSIVSTNVQLLGCTNRDIYVCNLKKVIFMGSRYPTCSICF